MATAVVEERQLLKTLRWWDGFVIALCNPGFLLGSLGFTLGIFGAAGSMILWGASAIIGMAQAWIYSESATMFGNRSGGISLYAHEGWRRYTTLVGPLSAFGYWIGWSVVLSIFGKVIGDLICSQWFPTANQHLFYDRLEPRRRLRSDRDRDDLRRLGVQHHRRPAGRVVQLHHRRPADDPARDHDVRRLPRRRMALPQRPRDVHGAVGRRQARARVHVHPRLVGLRHRGVRDVRARIPGHQARHRPGAAQLRHVHADAVRAAAARPRRRRRRQRRSCQRRRRASSTPRR